MFRARTKQKDAKRGWVTPAPFPHAQASQAGFTLVELAVVIVVAGVLLGGAMMLMKPYVDRAQRNATQTKLEKIADALALFVQSYGSLPCVARANPVAEPFGSPVNSGANGTNLQAACGNGIPNDYVGIVPFRALGLTEDNVRDGYGNLITYAVSPAVARFNPTDGFFNRVHEQCLTSAWYESGTHRNPVKARFCCARFAANSDIRVLDGLGSTNQVFGGLHSNDATQYGLVTNPPVAANDVDNRLIAFTLVSHGPNGDGAFLANTANIKPITADAGAEESENRDNDLEFVQREWTRVDDATYFDDIILWRTNDQVIGQFGNDSCGRP